MTIYTNNLPRSAPELVEAVVRSMEFIKVLDHSLIWRNLSSNSRIRARHGLKERGILCWNGIQRWHGIFTYENDPSLVWEHLPNGDRQGMYTFQFGKKIPLYNNHDWWRHIGERPAGDWGGEELSDTTLTQ